MKWIGILAGYLLYLEAIYHFGCFGAVSANPVPAVAAALFLGSLEVLVLGLVNKKCKKVIFWLFAAVQYILFAAQIVYLGIFRVPLLWEAALRTGGAALTNYWRETLDGIVSSLIWLILAALPLPVFGVLLKWRKCRLPQIKGRQLLLPVWTAAAGIFVFVGLFFTGKLTGREFYEEYHEFYDPLSVAQNMGVLTLAQRDTAGELQAFWDGLKKQENADEITQAFRSETGTSPESADQGTAEETQTMQETESLPQETETIPAEPDTSPQELPIDFAYLKEISEGKEQTWLAEYMEGLTPTKRNAYTGIFKGYNLIYLTAEGFSTYAIREDLTPTLYRLTHSGFIFENYYVPLWQTSTSDGEYINCTGLIPDGQFSMRKSGSNDMAFTLPRYFAAEGVVARAYHDNSLSYYDRYITHNNLGYLFKAARTGDLDEEEWKDSIFPMEHPSAWPASDLEMMQGTIPEYVNDSRFHVYYMTVSGHMNYNFKGNAMSAKNKEAVAGLSMSENARAYIACHIELDKALEYLLEQLEAAGQLENTVICLSADHYPYGMSQEQYEELAGKDLSENLDLYRNSLILWNAGMEEEPVVVDKVCGSMDILPTLLNLFGFDYDSRLYAGKDIFSEDEGMVIFNDRSFVTDTLFYNRKAKTSAVFRDSAAGTDVSGNEISLATSHTLTLDEEQKKQYLEERKQEVKDRYQFSAYILRNDYYHKIKEAMSH